MKTKFLSIGYVAMALLKIKENYYHESSIKMTELNRFNHFLQQEFNNQNLDIAIITDCLSTLDFEIINGNICPTISCSYNLYKLPLDIYNVVTDLDLIEKYITRVEEEKLQNITTVLSKKKLQAR